MCFNSEDPIAIIIIKYILGKKEKTPPQKKQEKKRPKNSIKYAHSFLIQQRAFLHGDKERNDKVPEGNTILNVSIRTRISVDGIHTQGTTADLPVAFPAEP